MAQDVKLDRDRVERIAHLLQVCGNPACSLDKIQEIVDAVLESTNDEIALATSLYCHVMLSVEKQIQAEIAKATAERDAHGRVH